MIFPFDPDRFSDEDIECPEIGAEQEYEFDSKRAIELLGKLCKPKDPKDQRIAELEAELAEVKWSKQILYLVAQGMAERCREIDPQCKGELPVCWQSYINQAKAKEN